MAGGSHKPSINMQMAAPEYGMVAPLSGIQTQAPQSLFVGLLFSGQHLIDAEHLGLRIPAECSFAPEHSLSVSTGGERDMHRARSTLPVGGISLA